MELIDRTKLPRTVTHYAETEYEVGFEEGQQSIIEAINDAPIVDAVLGVRCKDCNLSMPAYTNGKMSETEIYCPFLDIRKPNDWHCGDGLRKRKDAETQ